MNADISFKINQFVPLHLCAEHMQYHQIATKVKKEYNYLHCTTKLDMDANFAENCTFCQGMGRNNGVPNL